MEFAGLSHGHGARPGVTRGPRNPREQRVHRPGPAGVPRHAGVGSPAPSPGGELPADHQQADYFLRLLIQNRRLIDHRIDEYRKAVAVAEAKGDADGVRTFNRMTFAEQQDRQALDGMIDSLRRRFPRRAPGDGTTKTAPSLAGR
ncbi:hypothetical protein [Mycobacterium sp. Marseille-P9652]|uniref:hypothetical protein n=1 Tax=Mycobacterium sp. Marseille-P9652 TaxID=2654950 RepID=UPI0012E767DB|nr:hypothetical protein [Mycobacterium sp. Marseille-P9652]